MREILFRGKRIDNGEWIEGGICQTEGHTIILTSEDFEGILYKPPSSEFYDIEIIPETIGQYTGLTDKNGKKIFEGDIISIRFEEDRSPYEENVIYYENAEVYFDTEHCGWYVRYFDDESFIDDELFGLWEYDDCDITVIGNIYDNPELLKEDKDNG